MQSESEGAMKISAPRASKRAPTCHSCTITPKSLSGQPLDRVWIRRSRGWPERDFGVIVQLCHVGARFEALDALIFIVPSVSSCIFFTSLDFPLERCVLFWSVDPKFSQSPNEQHSWTLGRVIFFFESSESSWW